MIRGRIRRRGTGKPDQAEDEVVEIEAGGLSGVFATPSWLRDLGLTSWLLVGVALLLVGGVWLASLTETIVMPLIAAGMVAAVASPLVAWGSRHGAPRALGAALLLLLIVVLAVVVVIVVIGGITGQISDISGHLSDAKSTIEGWLKDLGVDAGTAQSATKDASSTSTDTVKTLLDGVAKGIESLSSLVFFLSLTALSLFFLLKDGPTIRAWGERRMGVPAPVAARSAGAASSRCAVTSSASPSWPPSMRWSSAAARWCWASHSPRRSQSSPSSPPSFPTSARGQPGPSRCWSRWAAPERTPPSPWPC